MDMKILLSVAAGLAGFCIAYHTGNNLKAILIPAGIAGVVTMLTPPIWTPPKRKETDRWVWLAGIACSRISCI